MSAPFSAPAGAYTIEGGLTTIRWGTDAFLKDLLLQPATFAASTAAIVVSIRQSRRGEVVMEENNAGYDGFWVFLNKGQEYDITVIDDISKIWPIFGALIKLQGPDDAAAIEFNVTEDHYNAERKKAGQRVIKAICSTSFTSV